MLLLENADIQPMNENERLISAIQGCFTDFLKEQKEQSNRLMDELKPKPPPVADKKTAFWNAYKILADEHDKELLQRYSTDLDTSLIFAGLFSAVDSAFIIQIQPEIQPHGARSIVIIAQCLLYISLFSTLLASLLAVLGKQWLMFYSAAGEKGSIEARGLERQRKLDGLLKWKFEAVIQMFPLLLQFALLLFWAALSIYLWTIHPSVASIVVLLTVCGFLAYCILLGSAVVHKDSPFQTPLVFILVRLISTDFWEKSQAMVKQITQPLYAFWAQISIFFVYICRSRDLLPRFRKQPAPLLSQGPTALFDISLLEPSPEISAVSWVLKTSTDLNTITQAANLAIDLQWPSTMDIQAQISRLWEGFISCFTENQSAKLIWLGGAYLSLCCADPLSKQHHVTFFIPDTCHTNLGLELHNVTCLAGKEPSLILKQSVNLKWILHVLPLQVCMNPDANLRTLEVLLQQLGNISRLSCSEFCDYLFCVNTFLLGGGMSQSDLVWTDKRLLLTTLGSKLKSNQTSMDLALKIIRTTHRLESSFRHRNQKWNSRDDPLRVYKFCNNLPHVDGWVTVVLAIGLLTESYPKSWYLRKCPGTPDWIYEALKSDVIPIGRSAEWNSKTQAGVAALLQALHHYDAVPPKESIHVILHALQIGGDISDLAAIILVETSWFQDPELETVLRDASVWTYICRGLPESTTEWVQQFICLGHTLAQLPGTQSQLFQEGLCAWISAFFSQPWWERQSLAEQYVFILTKIRKPYTASYAFINTDEEACGLTYVALSDIWEDFTFFTQSSLDELILWLHCSRKVLWHQYEKCHAATVAFQETFSVPLQRSFAKAAEAARHGALSVSSNGGDSLLAQGEAMENIAEILEGFGNGMATSVTGNDSHWITQRMYLYEKIINVEVASCGRKPPRVTE
ncbi:hypothetical protein DFH08DRAFT_940873 [Mycena albidolilacea]|uniref:DUF6535 domain-containing protein n=1 Tax=Mycena albidolilacea TaxID=1033008 RepID=A0AAD6ZKS8_9AGAR|nr:hypothetical protein DFH08DRAFT_940873 [Mycena albidolilacea]